MPELNEHDLRNLFHVAGHAAPAHDLTARIMARVSVTPVQRPVPVRPLIGKRGWLCIAAGLAAMIGYGLTGSADATPSWSDALVRRLAFVQLPQGEWPIWLAMGAGVALLFTLLDTVLRNRFRRPDADQSNSFAA